MKKKIAVVSGGPSSEHEVSLKSAVEVLKHLNKEKYNILPVVIDKKEYWYFPNEDPLELDNAIDKLISERVDTVFIAMHGEYGEDGFLQAVLDNKGIKYTGSGSEASARAINKIESQIMFESAGLEVPKPYSIGDKVNFPCVIKPQNGGSSVGVQIIYTNEELEEERTAQKNLGNPVLIQEYLQGREFTCGVLEGENGQAFSLIPTEIIPKNSAFFDYDSKYNSGASQEITPPNIDKAVIKQIQDLALTAHTSIGCRGMSRSDIILKDDILYILETNTIPGLTETSLLPQGAKALGISFSEMLDLIINASVRD